MGSGATFFCTGCRLENNSRFAGIANGGVFSLLDSVVAGRHGIVAVGGEPTVICCEAVAVPPRPSLRVSVAV